MAMSVIPSDIDEFLLDKGWVICSTYHTGPKVTPGTTIFGSDMLLDILYIADWNK